MENSVAILNTVHFSSLINWSFQYLVDSEFSYNEDYELVFLGSFLTRNKTAVDIQDDIDYKRVTVSAQNRGIKVRDSLFGKKIGTKKQFFVSENQFLLSKIDARNGAFGIVPNEIDGAIITGNFWTYDVDYTVINPTFLSLIVTTPEFIEFCERASNGTTNRHYLQEDLFLTQQIPLPTLKEQNRIVTNYNLKLNLAEQQEEKANQLEEEIENYLNDILGLKKLKEKQNEKGLQLINFKNLDRWDVLTGDLRILNGLSTSKYELKKIGDVFDFPSKSWQKKLYKSETFRYIELGAIDENFGITKVKEIQVKKAPSRATQQVSTGDLIIGTTRPYLKRFAIVSEQFDGDICSSGFSIIEPSDNYDLNYLKEFLMSFYGIEQLKNRMTGGTYPAITNSELKEILIPFPNSKTQKEIGSKILAMKKQIKDLKNNSKQNQNHALKEFEQEIFTN